MDEAVGKDVRALIGLFDGADVKAGVGDAVGLLVTPRKIIPALAMSPAN